VYINQQDLLKKSLQKIQHQVLISDSKKLIILLLIKLILEEPKYHPAIAPKNQILISCP
jgi:hypothetical protein